MSASQVDAALPASGGVTRAAGGGAGGAATGPLGATGDSPGAPSMDWATAGAVANNSKANAEPLASLEILPPARCIDAAFIVFDP